MTAHRTMLTLVGAVMAWMVPGTARADDSAQIGIAPRTDEIYGGNPVAACGWPTTVSMQGQCSGTLVHPEVVIYAAHCGAGYSSVAFGERGNSPARSAPVDFCKVRPGGGLGGTDHAFCKLAEPVTDVPIVPILMGCETDLLDPGREVTIVGFGQADDGSFGTKREVTAPIVQITSDGEAHIGGNGKDSCQGDSGGPVYIRLPAEDGFDDTWRVFGITSHGGACGTGGYYSMMHMGMEWFESESGVDLTPCHTADGQWQPGPDCFQFPKQPGMSTGAWASGCGGGPVGAYSGTCGAPYNSEPDDVAPIVTVVSPTDGTRFDSDPATALADVLIEVSADDADGWGVQQVQLAIDGTAIMDGIDGGAPYEFEASFPPGIYEITAIATDFAGNVATSDAVTIGIDMDPPQSPDPGGDGDGGTDDDGGTAGDPESGGTGAEDTGLLDERGDDGCGCAAHPTETPLGLVLLTLLGMGRLRPDSRQP